MDSLLKLADEAGIRLAHRRPIVRGALVGAITYGAFTLELALGELGTRGMQAFLVRVLFNVAFGLAAGAAMGAVFALVLARFSRRGLLAFVTAGVAASAVLVAPFVAIVAKLFGIRGFEVGALVATACGAVLGLAAWVQARWGRAAA